MRVYVQGLVLLSSKIQRPSVEGAEDFRLAVPRLVAGTVLHFHGRGPGEGQAKELGWLGTLFKDGDSTVHEYGGLTAARDGNGIVEALTRSDSGSLLLV